MRDERLRLAVPAVQRIRHLRGLALRLGSQGDGPGIGAALGPADRGLQSFELDRRSPALRDHRVGAPALLPRKAGAFPISVDGLVSADRGHDPAPSRNGGSHGAAFGAGAPRGEQARSGSSPEGTRVKPGQTRAPKLGVSFLAAKTGAWVQPVRLVGTSDFPRSFPLEVRFGSPLPPPTGEGRGGARRGLAMTVMDAILRPYKRDLNDLIRDTGEKRLWNTPKNRLEQADAWGASGFFAGGTSGRRQPRFIGSVLAKFTVGITGE